VKIYRRSYCDKETEKIELSLQLVLLHIFNKDVNGINHTAPNFIGSYDNFTYKTHTTKRAEYYKKY
jgi:hypothetical protein